MLSLVLLLAVSATSADVQATLHGVLHGGGTSSADAQRSLSRLMGWTDETPSGIVGGGSHVSIRDLDMDTVRRELGYPAPVRHFFAVSGEGPAPLRIHIPAPDASLLEVYRRVKPGLYVRLAQPLAKERDSVWFDALAPGEFLCREVDELSYPDTTKGYFDFTPPSDAPEAKADWRLYRVEPERIAGPMPIILIAGAGSDRWANFIHWAANSSEASELRQRCQLWNYYRTSAGVNVAVGFSRGYPGFEESIVAYLDRFIRNAMAEGAETDGVRYFFPDGPYSILTHSHGGLVARAFLKNYPEQAARVAGVVTLSAPHMGIPWAIPEWARHTVTRLGFSSRRYMGVFLDATVGSLFRNGWFSPARQSDLDMGWVNADAAGGFGIPYARFQVFERGEGMVTLTLSPRDANRTGARDAPGYDDATFDPPSLLSTYCGGLDDLLPGVPEELHLDKLYVYGSYVTGQERVIRQVAESVRGLANPAQMVLETLALSLAADLMGVTVTRGADLLPLGAYALNDGLCPLQSLLMLDSAEGEALYETLNIDGWPVAAQPLEPRMDLIAAHTLADPDKLRILPGWTHLETVTGRYDRRTGRSELFSMVAADLLHAVGADP